MPEHNSANLFDSPRYVDHHLVYIYFDRECTELMVVFYFGDDVLGAVEDGDRTRVYITGGRQGWVKGKLRLTEKPPLALAFIDVGQGDACVVTTPDGHRVLIDGGENQQAARYLAKRFQHETAEGRMVLFDAVVITHGDADHFAGLSTLVIEAAEEDRPYKQIRFATKRLFHNGLVKRPGNFPDGPKRPDTAMLGKSEVLADRKRFVTDLVDDPRDLPESELNKHFKRWKTAMEALQGRHSEMEVHRLDHTKVDAFDFIKDVRIEVFGPRTVTLDDDRLALPFLKSSSQTINGHSVILKLSYGQARVLLTGDLTEMGANQLLALHEEKSIDLEAHVLKVPHHGSSDYSIPFLQAIRPTVSIISAGDENAMKDHLHPRANVVGALGNAGRGDEPLIFVTNLSAFDRYAGRAFKAKQNEKGEWVPDLDAGTFYARERSVYGIIHVRTDGKQLFVARKGAKPDNHEAYAFKFQEDGTPCHINLDEV